MVHVAKEMQREGFQIPLLIGGATTSAKHTAVRIAPCYHGITLHVKDASRCVGVVDRLDEAGKPRATWIARIAPPRTRTAKASRNAANASWCRTPRRRRNASRSTGRTADLPKPAFVGMRVIDDLPLETLVPYIDWSPFFMAWEMKGKYPEILQGSRSSARKHAICSRRPRRC